MALVQKKGGPYTKHDQVERKKKVYNLHFEKSYSAIKIAEMLDVNRNTINDDIQYWYAKISEELPEYNLCLLIKQTHKLEMQQARLSEELERCTKIKDKLIIEKLLFSINSKMISEISKMVFNHYHVFRALREKFTNQI